MILTGKAKEDFENYILNENLRHDSEVLISVYNQETLFINYNNVKETLLNALIIEWFDSVGIYISINYVDFYDELRNDTGFETYVTNKGLSVKFRNVSSRQEAIKQAIKKANEIYNNKN